MNEKIVALNLGDSDIEIIEGVNVISAGDDMPKDTDLLFIVDIFGKHKDLAFSTARSAKSNGVLVVGIPVTYADDEEMLKFREIFDAVVIGLYPSAVIRTLSEILKASMFFFSSEIMNALRNTGTAYAGMGYAERLEPATLRAIKSCGDIRNAKSILLTIKSSMYRDTLKVHDTIREALHEDVDITYEQILDRDMQGGIRITMIACMNDSGFRTYEELLEHESIEAIADMIRNGLTDTQIFRLGSYEKFFADAIIHGDPAIVRLFINNGADPKSLESGGAFPESILQELITKDNGAEILQMLLDSNITLPEDVIASLACFGVSPEMLRALIAYGCDVNTRGEYGTTPLMIASSLCSPEIIGILIEAGADINAKNADGLTALDSMLLGTRCRDEYRERLANEILPFMLRAGAKTGLLHFSSCNADFLRSVYFIFEDGREMSNAEYQELYNNWKNILTEEYSRKYSEILPRLFSDAVENYNPELVKRLLELSSPEYLKADKLPMLYRTNFFPEACTSERTREIKARLDKGAEILNILRNAGVNIPASVFGGKELTYVYDKYMNHDDDSKYLDSDLAALCCAYSPKALEQVIFSGVDVKDTGHIALEVIMNNSYGYYSPEKMIMILLLNDAEIQIRRGCINIDDMSSGMLLSGIRRLHVCDIAEIKTLLYFTKFGGVSLNSDYDDDDSPYFYDIPDPLHASLVKHMWEILESVYAPRATYHTSSLRKQRDINIILASYCGNKYDIEDTIREGSDVNASTWLGYTPLMYASVFNTAEAVQYLIDNGASVNARSRYHQTALTLCVLSNYRDRDPKVIGVLARNGADVNAVYDDGSTVLMLAAEYCGNSDVITALIDAGADIHATRKDGECALTIALKARNFAAVRTLIAAGADVSVILDRQ